MSNYKFQDKLDVRGLYKIKYYKAVFLPIIIHGLFDFLIMVSDLTNMSIFFMLSIVELLIVYIYLRYLILKVERQFPETENIHTMIEEKRLSPPCSWFIH